MDERIPGALARAFVKAVGRMLNDDFAADDAFYANITKEEDNALLRTMMTETSPGVFDQKVPGDDDDIMQAEIYAAVLSRTGREDALKALVPVAGNAQKAQEVGEALKAKAPAFSRLFM